MQRQYLFHSSAFVLALIGASAHAQQLPPVAQESQSTDTVGIEDIVVTAQKRSENVQDVPIAISAFTASALEGRAVQNVSALSNVAPNVTLDAGTPFSGSSQVLSAYIRGIGANDFAMNLDPGVGIYLDGVYLARTIGANLDLPDVERIEILKGPQGTLFGRNTIGGAISVVTSDPAKEFGFKGSVTTGRYNRLDAKGTIDLPLADRLAASVTFSVKNRDGYQKRLPFPNAAQFVTDPAEAFGQTGRDTASREGGENVFTLRGKLKWEPTDRLTIRLGGDYSKSDQSATANSVLAVNPNIPGNFAGAPTSNIPGTAFDPTGQTGFLFAGLYNFCIGATPGEIASRNAQALCGSRGTPLNPSMLLGGIGSVNVDGNPNNNRLPIDNRWISANKDQSFATGNSFDKMTAWGITSNIDFDLTDNVTLKSITGYRDLQWRSGMDLDNSPIAIFEPSFSLKQWQFSQEFQLTGQAIDDKLKYVLGAYYFQEQGKMRDYVTFAQGLLQIFGPNDLKTKNYAFFGQLDYRLSDLIGITVGGRYTNERKTFLGAQQDLNGFNYKLFNCPVFGQPCTTALGFPDPTDPLRYYVPGVQKKKFNNFSPKVGIQLHPTDDVMAYGSWSRGYKTGGWTTRLSNPLPFAPSFDEEKAETFEIGIKSTLLDRRLQINAAAFTTKYQNIQLNFQQGVSPTIQNAGNARIKGFEFEVTAIPVSGLTINASVGYLDAYYTNVAAAALVAPNFYQAGVFVGADLPKTPHWKINISPRYELELGGSGKVALVADYTHTSRVWNDTERTYLLSRPANDMLNLSATYTEPSDHWSVTAGATNVTNRRTITSGTNLLSDGLIFGTYNRPTEWYATLGVKF